MNGNRVSPLLASACALIVAWGNGCSTLPNAEDVPKILDGTVVTVQAGDTLTVIVGSNQQYKVQLAEIAAPDLGQAYGAESRQALTDKVRGKIVHVAVVAVDGSGSPSGEVYLGDRWINLEMVTEGAAWHDRKHSASAALASAESQACQKRVGLWVAKHPIPPWQYRNPVPVQPPEEEHPEPLIRIGL